MSPEDIGLFQSNGLGIVLRKLNGRHAIKARLLQLGYDVNGKELDDIFKQFKEVAKKKKSAEKRQKLKASASGHDGVIYIKDFEIDPIAEIFGHNIKSRCRAISFISSAKQVKIGQPAIAIASQNIEKADALHRLDKLENMILLETL